MLQVKTNYPFAKKMSKYNYDKILCAEGICMKMKF